MSLRIHVGVTKKLGLPEYSSVGASCSLDLEVDQGLLRGDPEGFREQVRSAYLAAHRAVEDELARLRGPAGPAPARTEDVPRGPAGPHRPAGLPDPDPGVGRAGPSRPATASQVRAIVSIARRQRADLGGLLGDHGVARPEDLSLADASRLIDQLRAAGRA